MTSLTIYFIISFKANIKNYRNNCKIYKNIDKQNIKVIVTLSSFMYIYFSINFFTKNGIL
jgi:hypothetical protein